MVVRLFSRDDIVYAPLLVVQPHSMLHWMAQLGLQILDALVNLGK